MRVRCTPFQEAEEQEKLGIVGSWHLSLYLADVVTGSEDLPVHRLEDLSEEDFSSKDVTADEDDGTDEDSMQQRLLEQIRWATNYTGRRTVQGILSFVAAVTHLTVYDAACTGTGATQLLPCT